MPNWGAILVYAAIIHEVEYNYAGFPLLTEEESAEYEVMKAALRDSVDAKAYLDYEAVDHYLAWFQNPHLRTCNIEQTNLWEYDVDYSSLFSYAPRKMSCKVDDETYLIRFPSCSGDPDEQCRAISKRTTIYGRDNTYGCLDISNVRSVDLPYSTITITIPTTVSHRLPDRCIDKEGISPDVRLDLPYPTDLTDNIDEWVLWIAQDLKQKASNVNP